MVDHIPTGPSPEMFELSRDETSLYVSDEEASAVQEISFKDKLIDRDIATGASVDFLLGVKPSPGRFKGTSSRGNEEGAAFPDRCNVTNWFVGN
jgi:hypothetical protein